MTHKHNGIEYEIEIDTINGHAEIWRDGARVDIIDLTDLLAGFWNNSKARAEQAIEQNHKQYETAKHNWFEEDL